MKLFLITPCWQASFATAITQVWIAGSCSKNINLSFAYISINGAFKYKWSILQEIVSPARLNVVSDPRFGRVSLVPQQASASFKASLTIETLKELVYCNGWPLDETPHWYPALLLSTAMTFDRAPLWLMLPRRVSGICQCAY